MKIEELKIDPAILRAIKEMKFIELTAIQEKCIPAALRGRDIVGQSETGSGKTAAFGLPILDKVEHGKGLQALILTPTRELCVQVGDAIASFGKYKRVMVSSVYGGVGIEPQVEAIRRSDIIVGTPGRMLDHMDRRTISFEKVRFLVLDEVDKMFEMGFVDDVEKIIGHVPKHRQTLLFGATLSDGIMRIADRHLHDPLVIKTQSLVDKSLLGQVYYNIDTREKFSLLVHLLKHKTPGLAMVFCATRREVDILTANLKMQSIHAMAIHGGLAQHKRLRALEALKREAIDVLVATDVAARGLDIRNVSHIYNYDVPKSSKDYIHRIGRTARAGANGDAVTLVAERDYPNFDNVLRDRTLEIRSEDLPEFERVAFRRHEGRRSDDGFRHGNRPGPPSSDRRHSHHERGTNWQRGPRGQSHDGHRGPVPGDAFHHRSGDGAHHQPRSGGRHFKRSFNRRHERR